MNSPRALATTECRAVLRSSIHLGILECRFASESESEMKEGIEVETPQSWRRKFSLVQSMSCENTGGWGLAFERD